MLCLPDLVCYDGPMIGNAADAALALHDYLSDSQTYLLSDFGCSRMVYLINGVIYKVNRRGYGDYNANVAEYKQYQKIRYVLPTGVTVPDMFIWDIDGHTILASEYIEGALTGECYSMSIPCDCPDKCIDDALVSALYNLGWDDPSYGNAIWSGDMLYLIDIA